MSKVQFGLPLEEPSIQTVLPVVMPSGKIFGFFPIVETSFTGEETEYELSQGNVPVTTVTLPNQVITNLGPQRVQQYVAAQWPADQEWKMPWRGYLELISVVDNNTLGFYSWWSQPVVTWKHHFNTGAYIGSLITGMNHYEFKTASVEPPDAVTPQSVRWACSLNLASFEQECSFFDFNWVALFESWLQSDPSREGTTIIPLSISTVSNPSEGYFKASIVQGNGGQTIVPGGGTLFNTVRILRLSEPETGDYVFNFSISSSFNGTVQSTPVSLTLTIV